MPLNTRYNEWADTGSNEIPMIMFGDVAYTQAEIDAVNDHLQMVLDLPAPPKPSS